jgi:hypothetical protein
VHRASSEEVLMPTSLPQRRKTIRRPDWWLVFLCSLVLACFAVELIDPAPTDVEAALVAAVPAP